MDTLCKLAHVSRSGYYKWFKGADEPDKDHSDYLKIKEVFDKGNCIDNAPIESFFGHMKDELDYQSCQSFEKLRLNVDEYMRYYNNERKQWTRNKMTPVEYRNHLLNRSRV